MPVAAFTKVGFEGQSALNKINTTGLENAEQLSGLLQQLPAVPHLAHLSIQTARWLETDGSMRRLLDTLQQCRRLHTVQLVDCRTTLRCFR